MSNLFMLLLMSFAARPCSSTQATATTTDTTTMIAANLTEFVQVSASSSQTCAVSKSGKSYCWGYEEHGELGAGADGGEGEWTEIGACEGSLCGPSHRRRVVTRFTKKPVLVAGDAVWTTISTNKKFTCAIDSAKKAHCWGQCQGSSGTGGARPCGSGSLTEDMIQVGQLDQPDSTASSGGTLGCGHDAPSCEDTWDAISLSPSGQSLHGCGITSGKKLKCWGQGNFRAMGDGELRNNDFPMAVSGGDLWLKVSSNERFGCGITTTHVLKCWGFDATVGGDQLTPAIVSGSSSESWTDVSVGKHHACGITIAKEAKCWGVPRYGALGDGSPIENGLNGVTAIITPQNVTGGFKWLQISCGQSFTCGVTTDNQGMCWGLDNYCQLGQCEVRTNYYGKGSSGNRNSPQVLPGGYTWIQISSGPFHSCGITTENALLCWGQGKFGVLGRDSGSKTDSYGYPLGEVFGSKLARSSPMATTTTTTTPTTAAPTTVAATTASPTNGAPTTAAPTRTATTATTTIVVPTTAAAATPTTTSSARKSMITTATIVVEEPSTTIEEARTTIAEVQIAMVGSMQFSAGNLQQTQVESSSKKALASELQVDESAVQVNATQSPQIRRLEGHFRILLSTWTVDFIVSVPIGQVAAVETKVTDIKTNPASFSNTMKTNLVDAGVQVSEAIVAVNSFDVVVQTTSTARQTTVSTTTIKKESATIDESELQISGSINGAGPLPSYVACVVAVFLVSALFG